MKFSNLFNQVTYIIILILTVLLIVFLFVANHKMRVVANDNERQIAWQTLNNTIKKADYCFDKSETHCLEITKFVPLLKNDSLLLHETLTRLLENNHELCAAFIYFYDSTKQHQTYLVQDKNHIQRAIFSDYISDMKQKSLQEHFEKNNARPFWENPTISITDNQAYINFFAPFSDKSHKITGFAGFKMNMEWIDTLLHTALTYYKNDPNAFMFMLAADGSAVGVAGDVIEKNHNLIEVSNDDAFISMLYNMRNGETECITLKSNFIGTENTFFYKSLTNKKISIALSYHKNQSLNAWNRSFILILSLLLFSFGIITLWFWWHWKARAKMMNTMRESLHAIEIGSTKADLPSSSFYQDLGGLCHSINSMQAGLDKLKTNLIAAVQANVNQLNEIEYAKYIRRYFYSTAFQHYDSSVSGKINQCVRRKYLTDRIAGDFNDFFNISPQKICFVTGTVSLPKKSISNMQTALDIFITMNLIRSHFKTNSPLRECIMRLNNDLYSQNNGNFTVNAFIGILNCETGILEYVSAGAPPYYMISHRSIFSIPAQHGLPLASRPNGEYVCGSKEFSNGDMLMIHTEGVLSRQNTISDKYKPARLQNIMAASSMMPPDEFLEAIYNDIDKFTYNQPMQVDDYTLFALKWTNSTQMQSGFLF